jgi:hypothetical protein
VDKNQELVNAVLESANRRQESDDRKRLMCAEAFELAKNFETEIIDVGRILQSEQHKNL